MKRNTVTCLWGGLLLAALSLTFSACKDNDLDASNNNGGNQDNTEAFYDKQEALTCLLGGVADLDSLPENWNSASFAATPTIGQADEANPHVRYVVTNNVDEANRIYKSLIAGTVTETASNDTWTKEGIGSLTFNVKNEASLFATLDVNVKQLPTLEQIRFVPASALGNNATNMQKTFYQLGDVVAEKIGVDEEGRHKYIYWVCVSPCSIEKNNRKSHWCSFQLVAKDEPNSNYANKGTNKYLPTKLCSKQSAGIEMIPNFFSLLTILSNPEAFRIGADGFCGTPTKEINMDQIKAISYMWDYLGLWQNGKVATQTFKGISLSKYDEFYGMALEKTMRAYQNMNAFYYGYNTNFLFGSGNYRVYNLQMSRPDGQPTYSNCTPQVPWLYKNHDFDFSEFETGGATTSFIDSDDGKPRSRNQFIVRYRTGAEFDGKTGNDVNPEGSFEDRFATTQTYDVLLSKQVIDKTYEDTGEPFYAFGDMRDVGTKDFCIKEAHTKWTNSLTNMEDKYAYFINAPVKSNTQTQSNFQPSDKFVTVIMTHLINAKLISLCEGADDQFSPCKYIQDETLKALYYKCLKRLYNESEIFLDAKNKDPYIVKVERNDNQCYTLKARFTTGTYSMTFDPNKWLENQECAYTLEKSNKDDNSLPILSITRTEDNYTFHTKNDDIKRRTLGKTKADRALLRKDLGEKLLQNVLENSPME